MSHVNAKRALLVALIFSALALIAVGISYAQNYAEQETRRETLTNQSVIVPPNGYGQIHLQLNRSDDNLGLSMRVTNGTIREASINEELYHAWVNGSYSPGWYEMPNPAQQHNPNDYEESYLVGSGFPQSIHYIFWNPDSSVSKQVTITAYIEYKETIYNTANLEIGILFTVLGAAGLGGKGGFFVYKNRDKIKVTRRKALMLAGLLLMIVLGGFLATTYANPVQAQTTIGHGTVSVPANDYRSVPFTVNRDGQYIAQFNVDNGSIQVFQSGDGSVISHWSNGTEFDIRKQNRPINVSSGITGMDYMGCTGTESPWTDYYILSNSDNYSKNVSYEITYNWTYNNYVAMMAGIALVIFGSIAFVLMLLKGKLKEFNNALDNQE
jgi:hypothetical protein